MDVLQLIGLDFAQDEEDAKRIEAKRILEERDWKPSWISVRTVLVFFILLTLPDIVRYGVNVPLDNLVFSLLLALFFESMILVTCLHTRTKARYPEYDWAEAYREEDP